MTVKELKDIVNSIPDENNDIDVEGGIYYLYEELPNEAIRKKYTLRIDYTTTEQ